MAGVNKVILVGNVGGDPEIRTLPSGSKVANFSLATSESYTDRTGQKQTQTEWHRIELWDGLAGIAEQYVRKGDPLYVEGSIRNEKWTDKSGIERSGVRIRCLSMQMLGSRSSGGNDATYDNQSSAGYGNNSGGGTSNAGYASTNATSTTATGEEDLPF